MGKPKKTDSILQFKIILNDSTPRVWRRILVPADYTFFALHCAIQDAVGWTDGHLHAFYVGKGKMSDRITIEFPNPEGDDLYRGETRDERKEYVADYLGKITKQCIYCYDFGDNWSHTVLLERELPRSSKMIYPHCVAGENACPPEDCGGVWGYADLQKILKNPHHKEHADMLEWLGLEDPKEFDPHEFDPANVEFENPKIYLAEWNREFGSR